MLQSSRKKEYFKGVRFPYRLTHINQPSPNGYLVFPHWHEHIEFIQVKSGRALITIESHQIEIKEKDIVFINSGQIHAVEAISGVHSSIGGLIFDKFFLENITGGIESRYLYIAYLNGHHQHVYSAYHPIWTELNECMKVSSEEYVVRDICYEMKIKACIYRMIAAILRNYKQHNLDREHDKQVQVEQHFAKIGPVLDYIERHIAEPLYLEPLSSLINMSPFHFSRFFKKITGITLTEYIRSTRIGLAKKLLIDRELSVTEIAETTGFCDIQYFGKVFKRETGVSPSQFQTNFQREEF